MLLFTIRLLLPEWYKSYMFHVCIWVFDVSSKIMPSICLFFYFAVLLFEVIFQKGTSLIYNVLCYRYSFLKVDFCFCLLFISLSYISKSAAFLNLSNFEFRLRTICWTKLVVLTFIWRMSAGWLIYTFYLLLFLQLWFEQFRRRKR